MEPKHFDPHTAREILAAFFHSHALHTVTAVSFGPKHVDLTCSCGTNKMRVFQLDMDTKGWSKKEVGYALRNVPRATT